MLGTGSSSRLLVVLLEFNPLPLRGLVCGQPEARPYPPSGAESLLARLPFLPPWSSGFVRWRLRPWVSSNASRGPGDGGSGVDIAGSYRLICGCECCDPCIEAP